MSDKIESAELRTFLAEARNKLIERFAESGKILGKANQPKVEPSPRLIQSKHVEPSPIMPEHPSEKILREFEDRLRASGVTVQKMAPSETQKYAVTFPRKFEDGAANISSHDRKAKERIYPSMQHELIKLQGNLIFWDNPDEDDWDFISKWPDEKFNKEFQSTIESIRFYKIVRGIKYLWFTFLFIMIGLGFLGLIKFWFDFLFK